MLVYPPTAADLFAGALADEFRSLYPRGRRMLAVDALAPAEGFTASVADALRRDGTRVFSVPLDGFLRPASERNVRGDTGAAIYFDRFDHAALIRALVEPFLLGGSTGFVPAVFDASRDRPVEPVWQTAPADAVLIVSGPFLLRPELRGRFHFTIHLDAGAPADAAWAEATTLYEAQSQPRRNASAVVDFREPARPTRVFADLC